MPAQAPFTSWSAAGSDADTNSMNRTLCGSAVLGVSALMAGVYNAIRCVVACSGVESEGTLEGLRRALATITEQTVSQKK